MKRYFEEIEKKRIIIHPYHRENVGAVGAVKYLKRER